MAYFLPLINKYFKNLYKKKYVERNLKKKIKYKMTNCKTAKFINLKISTTNIDAK